MKLSLYLSLGLATLSGVLSQSTPPYKTYWFNQTLDHFDPQDTRTFMERYLVYDNDWDKSPNSPIFFYAGNEGPIDGFYNNTGFMFDIAPDFNALVIFAEHRYYGQTLPFGEDSFTNSNLEYLTVELAVADYAVFLTQIKQDYGIENAPVVVFGGSYGGILAAACRIHYPSVFDMALAASAPVKQTLNTVNATTFFRLVTDDYNSVSKSCPMIVRQGFSQLINLANSNDYSTISSTFNVCTQLSNNDDITLLELWARNGLLTMAMADYPYSADFLGSLPAWPVNASCNLMISTYDNNGKDDNAAMMALAAGAGLYYNASEDDSLTCFNLTNEFIECADQTGCGLGNDAISWDYQMCTEIVYAVNTNNITDMFPPRIWELKNLTEYCNNKYGVTPNPTWMQIWYPLDVANSSSKIIFSNGLLDPWHGGGYLTSPSNQNDMPAVILSHGAHHLDLRGSNPADPQDAINARKNETMYIKTWLEEIEMHKNKPQHKRATKVIPKRLRI